MISAPPTEFEQVRQQTLLDYQILDTPPEDRFDRLTRLAASIAETPVALISLVDENRQWFKSRVGLDATETPRDVAFCAHAIHSDEPLIVPDCSADPRFFDNPLVTGEPNVAFYAGFPLISPQGHKLGTLCVIDQVPRELPAETLERLAVLAAPVMSELELGKAYREQGVLLQQQIDLVQTVTSRNDELAQLSYRTSHDLKAPIVRIKALAQFAVDDLLAGHVSDAQRDCETIIDNCNMLAHVVEGIVDLTRADLKAEEPEPVCLEDMVQETFNELEALAKQANVRLSCEMEYPLDFETQQSRMRQILYNLISNGIKYADPNKADNYVAVRSTTTDDNDLRLVVEDNGLGIAPEFHNQVCEMFTRFHPQVANGSGLGLTIVKKHVDGLQGHFGFTSNEAGSRFTVTLPTAAAEIEVAPCIT